MKFLKGCIRFLVRILTLGGILIAGTLFALLGTTSGARFLTKMSMEHFLNDQDIAIENISGTVSERVRYADIEVKDLPFLPAGSVLKVKGASVSFASLSLEGVNAQIEQARLFLPASDPVLIQGKILGGVLDVNVFSNYVSFRDIESVNPDNVFLKSLSGDLGPLDIVGSGPFSHPRFTGKIYVQKLMNRMARVEESEISFDLEAPGLLSGAPGVTGMIRIHSGKIFAQKTAEIQLEESSLRFLTEMDDPTLDIKGRSVVEGVKIKLICTGTLKHPDITLSSSPPLPEQQLLVMLATGKGWKGTASDLNNGRVTADTARDFLDYFLFGGAGSQLAKKLGIKDFSVTLEKGTQGIGVTKSLSENIDATYAVEQTKQAPGEETTKQKVGGEVKLNDKISVGAEREFINATSPADNVDQTPQTQTSDTFFMKFKTKF